MAYRSITNSAFYLPKVSVVVSRLERYYFRPVHALFRLPTNDIQESCFFVIAQTLLSAIAGASTTLYGEGATDGDRFRGMLLDFYPFEEERMRGSDREVAVDELYRSFRCPIVHDVGVNLKGEPKRAKVLRVIKQGAGLSEDRIEQIEAPVRLPNMVPTIRIEDDAVRLVCEALYWGTRTMVARLTCDGRRMLRAEAVLPDHL